MFGLPFSDIFLSCVGLLLLFFFCVCVFCFSKMFYMSSCNHEMNDFKNNEVE